MDFLGAHQARTFPLGWLALKWTRDHAQDRRRGRPAGLLRLRPTDVASRSPLVAADRSEAELTWLRGWLSDVWRAWPPASRRSTATRGEPAAAASCWPGAPSRRPAPTTRSRWPPGSRCCTRSRGRAGTRWASSSGCCARRSAVAATGWTRGTRPWPPGGWRTSARPLRAASRSARIGFVGRRQAAALRARASQGYVLAPSLTPRHHGGDPAQRLGGIRRHGASGALAVDLSSDRDAPRTLDRRRRAPGPGPRPAARAPASSAACTTPRPARPLDRRLRSSRSTAVGTRRRRTRSSTGCCWPARDRRRRPDRRRAGRPARRSRRCSTRRRRTSRRAWRPCSTRWPPTSTPSPTPPWPRASSRSPRATCPRPRRR